MGQQFGYFSDGGSFSTPSNSALDSVWAMWQDFTPHAWKTSLEALDRLLRGLINPEHSPEACPECKLAGLRQTRAEIHRTREAAAILGIEIPQYKGNAHVWTTRITLLLLHLRREGIPCLNEPTDTMLDIIEAEIEATKREIEAFGEDLEFWDMKGIPITSRGRIPFLSRQYKGENE